MTPLPRFMSVRARRQAAPAEYPLQCDVTSPSDEGTAASDPAPMEQSSNVEHEHEHEHKHKHKHKHKHQHEQQHKRKINHKRNAAFVSSFSFFIAFLFLLLVVIGQTSIVRPNLLSYYFFELDISDIYPEAFGSNDIAFVNSIARSLGLHDFYRVGLWNFCEGYNDEGVTYCATPKGLYYFNPVTILLNELLYGATITLPSIVVIILTVVQVISAVFFIFFMAALPMLFICIFLSRLAGHSSRRFSVPVSVFSTLTAVLVLTGSILATVLFAIFEIAVTSQTELNIRASLGLRMLAFMWTATVAAAVGAHLHLCMCCCCRPRKPERKKKSRKFYGREVSWSCEMECWRVRRRADDDEEV